MPALVQFAQFGMGVDLDATRRGLETVHRGSGSTRSGSAARTRPEIDDYQVFAFWLSSNVSAVAAWVDALAKKFERVNSWGIASFTLVDYQHQVRLVVRSREVVSAIPFPPKRRAA